MTGMPTGSSQKGDHANRYRLAKMVRQRRIQLGIKQEQISELGGPSADTIVRFESGKIGDNPQDRTLIGLDTALRWRPGSCRSILEGRDPAPVDHPGELGMARKLRTVMNQGGSTDINSWSPIPRRSIQDLATAAHKLVMLCQLSQPAPGIAEMATRIHLLAADMLTVALAAEHGDDELLALLDAIGNEGQAGTDYTDVYRTRAGSPNSGEHDDDM